MLILNQSLGSPQYGLALDTTTTNLSIALSNFVEDTRSQTWHLGRDLSSQLHLHLNQILKPQTWSDLKFIAVAKGPGSFTSIRIGVVTARTLAQQLQIPVYGISNLVAIAFAISVDLPENKLIAVQMDTKREQVFGGVYQFTRSGECKIYLQDSTMDKDQWERKLDQLNQPYELYKTANDSNQVIQSLLAIGKLQYQQEFKQPLGKEPVLIENWAKVTPFYGQHPIK